MNYKMKYDGYAAFKDANTRSLRLANEFFEGIIPTIENCIIDKAMIGAFETDFTLDISELKTKFKTEIFQACITNLLTIIDSALKYNHYETNISSLYSNNIIYANEIKFNISWDSLEKQIIDSINS